MYNVLPCWSTTVAEHFRHVCYCLVILNTSDVTSEWRNYQDPTNVGAIVKTGFLWSAYKTILKRLQTPQYIIYINTRFFSTDYNLELRHYILMLHHLHLKLCTLHLTQTQFLLLTQSKHFSNAWHVPIKATLSNSFSLLFLDIGFLELLSA